MNIWIRIGAVAIGLLIAVNFAKDGMWLEVLVMLGLALVVAVSPNQARWAR